MSQMRAAHGGKVFVIAVFALAAVAATATIVYYYNLQHRPLELWGPEPAALIVQAPRVEAWRLAPRAGGAAAPNVNMMVETRRDVSEARGLSHVRQALLNDPLFDWTAPEPLEPPAWRYALHFVDGERSTTVLFSFYERRVGLAESGRTAAVTPSAAEGWRAFFDEQFGEGATAAPSPES